MPYAERKDIELIYGKDNTEKYADADNTCDAKQIVDRIAWSLEYATYEVDSRLASGPYDVPFAVPYPRMIVLLTASLAGLYLYDTRRIVTSDSPDTLVAQRENVKRWIRMILAGQMELLNPSTRERLSKSSENAPFVVSE